MIQNEKFDIFIAYHGNRTTGSERRAHELYEYIKNKEVFPGKTIKPYFHPETIPYGRFEDTPLIVARTPMFILVVDKNVKRTVDGQICMYREDGSLSNVYEEIRTFHDSPMYKNMGGDQAARLLITDDLGFKEAECLHPIFSGRTALNSNDAVVDWIRYFYQNIYVVRLYNHCKYLATHRQDDFAKGEWVREAEEIWGYTNDENIGRTLMIYHMMAAKSGNRESIRRLRIMYEKYNCMVGLEVSTLNTLDIIRSNFL